MAAALLYSFCLTPLLAIAAGVVDSRMRATAVAIALFIVNLIGYGLGPPAMGLLSTWLKAIDLNAAGLTIEACKDLVDLTNSTALSCATSDAKGLQRSILLFSLGFIWASAHFLVARKTLREDMVTDRDTPALEQEAN